MRQVRLLLILIVAGLGSAHAADNELTVVGGVDFGFKRLHLDLDRTRTTFSPSFVTINPNVVLGYGSFYGSVSYDKSVSADPGIGAQFSAGSPTATMLDYSRTDSTFTLGYRLLQSLSVFAGHTKGDNHFTETSFGNTLIVTDISYKEAGPFAGFAYNHAFGNGTLGLSVGYAKLDGDLRIVSNPGGATTTVSGDTTGLSYGLTWSGPLTGSLGYRVGLKATEYNMKEKGEINERYKSIFIGISNYF